MKNILLTGAAGRIGTALREELGTRYHFRCLDCKQTVGADDVVIADITDFDAVLPAMQGMDAVIHLAANPSVEQPWDDVYTSSIGGTYNVFEAARRTGINKIIYASSTYVLGWREPEKGQFIKPDDHPVLPYSLYGVGKAFGEVLGRFFTHKYDMSIICVRIGWFQEQPQQEGFSEPLLSRLCTARDLAQLVHKTLDTENLGFQIFYGVSGNTRRFWDISNAQELVGYEPQDNAEDFWERKS